MHKQCNNVSTYRSLSLYLIFSYLDGNEGALREGTPKKEIISKSMVYFFFRLLKMRT